MSNAITQLTPTLRVAEWNDGALLVERPGEDVLLSVEDRRALLAYLAKTTPQEDEEDA